jgi:hypothetical protein
MKKDFIVSKIEVPQDGSQYVFIALTDPNEPKSSVGGSGNSYPQSPFGKSGGAIPFTNTIYLSRSLNEKSTQSYV